MMQSNELIPALRTVLPSMQLPVVVSALRHDPLVWAKLSQSDFVQQAAANAQSQSELWNPAALALLALGSDGTIASLRSLPLQPLQPELRQKAARAYEDVFRSGKPPEDLEEAGLLALALRERRRLTDTWQGLREELSQTTNSNGEIQPDVWQTPVSCLFALAPDPVDLLEVLLPTDPGIASPEAIDLVLHAILSNPLPVEEQVSYLSTLLEGVETEGILTWLEHIASLGEVNLSAALSQRFLSSERIGELESRSSSFSKTNTNADPLLQSEPLDRVVSRQQLARFYQLAGQASKALPLLEANQAALHRLQASLAFHASTFASVNKDIKSSLVASQKTYQLAPDSPLACAGYASELLRNGQPEKAAELLAGAPDQPAVLLARARLAIHSGDLEAARRFTVRLVNAAPQEFLTLSEYVDLADALFKLNMYEDAIQAAENGLRVYPNSLDLLNILSQSLRSAGKSQSAAGFADLAVALAPDQIDQHRLFASMLSEAGDAGLALKERSLVVQMNRAPRTQDLLDLAAAAVQANQPEQAVAACQAVLERDPDCALAHAHYGEALALQGQLPAAVQRLEQATLLSPEQGIAWISLARLHSHTGDKRKAIETLRSAAHAAPDSPEIQLALAQASLEQSSPSEALPALRRAAALAPQSPQITVQLVQTLYELGHLDEARQLLSNARYLWPTLPDLAFWEAKTLSSLDEFQAALPALELVLRHHPQTIEPYLLYSRAMLKLVHQHAPGIDLGKSRQALLKALEIDPDSFEARMLVAETHSASGSLQEALDTYQELSEMDQAREANWSWRINLGLGRTAMALNQMDTAIAALQEAVQVRPYDLGIQQALAEAYHSARLTDEALVAARTALGMAPDDLSNLGWYAGLAVAMRDEGEAINVLEHACSLAPENAAVKNQLAEIQLKINDQSAALKSLGSVLDLDLAHPSDLRHTARLFLELKAPDKAAACIQKAIQSAPESSADLWAELAYLQNQVGDCEASQVSIQKGLDLRPFDPSLHTFYGNLLSGQNKLQAALSCYEQALSLLDSGQVPAPAATDIPWSYSPEDCSSARLHYRIAHLLHSLGDLRAALEHAELVIALDPEDIQARILASQAANSLLEFRLSQEFTGLSSQSKEPVIEFSTSDPKSALSLYSLQAELAFENDDLPSAQAAVDRANAISSEDPRVIASLARFSARQGEFQQGAEYLEKAISQLCGQPDQAVSSAYPTLPIAEAALELQQWDVALPLFQQVARSLPLEPLAQLSLARALVKAAEAQHLLPGLDVQRHVPGADKLGEVAYQQFEKAILAANRLSNSNLVARWHRRGQVIFHPCEKHVRALQSVAESPDDLAAILAAGLDGAEAIPVDLSNQYADHPVVLFQKSLACLTSRPQEALQLAQALVAAHPSNTLYQALLAKSADTSRDYPAVCQSIEVALASWPDEPAWQAIAARSWKECGSLSRSLEHWQQAFDLEPENAEYACMLGEAYSNSGMVDPAINTLNRAAQLDPERVETWISLANARRLAGDYSQAIASVEKAISLSPGRLEPLLISGEIALIANQPELARQRALSALDLAPNHPSAILLLARVYAHTGRSADALQAIEDALPMAAEPFELLVERTRLVRKLQGPTAALHELNDLAEQYPEEHQAQAELALALAETGQSEAAEKAAQASLLLKPDQPDLHLLLGRIQRSSGQLDQSLHHLSEAIQQKPHGVEAYLELGRAYQDRREYEQAQRVFLQAAALAPSDPRPVYQAGMIAKEIKDYVTAETMLRKAAGLASDDVTIRRQLAAIIAINLVHNPQEASIPS